LEPIKKPEWLIDLEKSQTGIEIIRKQVFKNRVDIISIEGNDNNTVILKWLDQYSGIDYIGKKENNQLITIACRIQWDIDYKTFTIRFQRTSGTKTEFDKRIEAIEKGYLYPIYTMQAYMIKNPLKILSCALIKTDILYKFITENQNLLYENTANKEGNKFKYVRWSDIEQLDSFWQYSNNTEEKEFIPEQLKIEFK